jgi:hypothetical protein
MNQREVADWLFKVPERSAEQLRGSDDYLKNVDGRWRPIGMAARLSTAAQVGVVVQLLLVMVAAAVGATSYGLDAMAVSSHTEAAAQIGSCSASNQRERGITSPERTAGR